MFLVVVLESACPPLELSLCRSSTVIVHVRLWAICWSVCRPPCESLLLRTLSAIPTATAVHLLQRLFVVFAYWRAFRPEVNSSPRDLVAVTRPTPDHVHAGTTPTNHLRHSGTGECVTRGGRGTDVSLPAVDDETKAIVSALRTGRESWKRADVEEMGLAAVRSSNEAECPVSWHASLTASLARNRLSRHHFETTLQSAVTPASYWSGDEMKA